ncbi:hypothetical protein [Peribacillus frigoritolerans]|uniref:hypothetical protein n=1 Tax=Peribacillus frigoritolerans TaxID=450367 RepID=UPI0032E37881
MANIFLDDRIKPDQSLFFSFFKVTISQFKLNEPTKLKEHWLSFEWTTLQGSRDVLLGMYLRQACPFRS